MPTMHTLGSAAAATGKSKATIAKALKSGRMSGTKLEDGSYAIDPAELHRVYPPAPKVDGEPERDLTPGLPTVDTEQSQQIMALQAKVDAAYEARITLLEDQLKKAEANADHWRQQAQNLLTDQRPATLDPAPRRWWPWGRV